MKFLPRDVLINLCEAVVTNPLFQPRFLEKYGLITQCNRGVMLIARVFGLKLTGRANAMIKHIRNSPDWRKVNPYDAFNHANNGALVVAVEEGLLHGHIVALCAGATVWSSKWSLDCPLCAGVGQRNGVEGINWQFKHIPDMYVWDTKPPITTNDVVTAVTTDYPTGRPSNIVLDRVC